MRIQPRDYFRREECTVNNITRSYFRDEEYTVWHSMAVLQGYSDLANAALNSPDELQEQQEAEMQYIVDTISTLLSLYKTVVSMSFKFPLTASL